MVYFAKHTKRTPAQKMGRILMGCAAIGLIVFLLWQVPYDILREERFRLYGETRTTGVVTRVHTDQSAPEGTSYFIDYKYIDQDGLARHATAPLPKDVWDRFQEGNRLEVLYVGAHPRLSRIGGEIEPAFQIWLRSVLQ